MEALFTLKIKLDLQDDAYLRNGHRRSVGGPDRAYLNYLYRDAQGREREEVAALWVLDRASTDTLLAGLKAPDPEFCARPFRVFWIQGGVVAGDDKPIGLDRAMWLSQALLAQDVLDREAQLFRPQQINVGDV